jgi:hypothetical protein
MAIEKSFLAAFGGREKREKRGHLALRKGTAVPYTLLETTFQLPCLCYRVCVEERSLIS